MRRRDVEGAHPFSQEIAQACGIYELGGLLMDDQGGFTAVVEAFELSKNEAAGGAHLSDLLRQGGYYSGLCIGCLLARQLGVETHLFVKIEGEPEICQYQIAAEESGDSLALKEVTHARLTEDDFVEWWAQHKQTKQTKGYRTDFQRRAENSYFDSVLESHGLRWGGNVDGLLVSPENGNQVTAVIENRYTRKCPIRNYDPAKHFHDDINTWRPLILLREQLDVPLLLMTYSRRTGEGRKAGLAQVINGPGDTDKLLYANSPALRRPVPPNQRIITSVDAAKQWLAAFR